MFVFNDKEIATIEELEAEISGLDEDTKEALRKAFDGN